MESRQLVIAALEVRKNSYSPYSKFSVGAALLCADGRVFTGTNVENSSYGATVCAERSAFCAAVGAGVKKFDKIAIAGTGDKYCVPCGICRQFMYEFAPDLTVICANERGEFTEYQLKRLFSDAFVL